MEAERLKVSELQENHLALSRDLAAAKTQEITQRRELLNVSEEVDNLKKQHAREIMDLETDVRKRDRQLQEMEEDLRVCSNDLTRERESNSVLRATISEQSNAHVALNAQNSALQAQIFALQASADSTTSSASHYRQNWEEAKKRVEFLEKEAQEHEMIRRRLHNTIQDLKGNIRVFARVRPVLPSELSSSGSSDPADAMAKVDFPDKRDHKEIVFSSSSESATGQERKEMWQFNFDRVRFSLLAIKIR